MRLKEYLNESKQKLKTEKNETGHIHYAIVDEDGNGKTTSTSKGKDHIHKIFEWIIQPAEGHLHNLEV